MKLTAENVQGTFMYLLYQEGENTDGHLKVEGIMATVGFHPERLAKSIDEIKEMITELPDSFRAGIGGGMSFLNLCIDKNGNQWADLHQTMDMLVCLGIASGAMRYLMPRNMWSSLPGGMPYLVIE